LILNGQHCAPVKLNSCNDGIELQLREFDRALRAIANHDECTLKDLWYSSHLPASQLCRQRL